MIVALNQTKTFKDLEWVFKKDGDSIANSLSPFEIGQLQIMINTGSDTALRLYFNPSDTTYGRRLEDRLSFHILENENYAGYIVGRTKGRFLKGYAYYEMKYNEAMYHCYEIGLGNKGLFLCIYQGDTLIAVVEKALKVIDFKDNYMLYLTSEKYFSVTALFTLYYDVTSYGNILERKVHSSATTLKFTRNKELLAKFDPLFIQRIKDEDKITI